MPAFVSDSTNWSWHTGAESVVVNLSSDHRLHVLLMATSYSPGALILITDPELWALAESTRVHNLPPSLFADLLEEKRERWVATGDCDQLLLVLRTDRPE